MEFPCWPPAAATGHKHSALQTQERLMVANVSVRAASLDHFSRECAPAINYAIRTHTHAPLCLCVIVLYSRWLCEWQLCSVGDSQWGDEVTLWSVIVSYYPVYPHALLRPWVGGGGGSGRGVALYYTAALNGHAGRVCGFVATWNIHSGTRTQTAAHEWRFWAANGIFKLEILSLKQNQGQLVQGIVDF